jgi:clan AA aspartic protease (TIGR02281 family)
MKQALVRLCLSLLLLLAPGLAAAETVELVREHGVFMVPVRINDAVTIPFVLDSGAADVSVPEDVFKTLLRTRTVTESDFREPGVYVTADGSKQLGRRFILHEVRVGARVVKDVVASVAPDSADPLLGQSFLGTLPGWAIDNTRHALVIGAGGEGEQQQAATPVPPQPAVPAPASPTLLAEAASAWQRGDYATAVSIFRPLAEQRNADAQFFLGTLYNRGQGVARDYAEAARWYRKAADQGDAASQTMLGVLYENGQGVARDYAEAARWYRKAADQGYAIAQNDLGVLYKNGRGVAQDYAEAARWYRKAADQGNATAQNNLARLTGAGPRR